MKDLRTMVRFAVLFGTASTRQQLKAVLKNKAKASKWSPEKLAGGKPFASEEGDPEGANLNIKTVVDFINGVPADLEKPPADASDEVKAAVTARNKSRSEAMGILKDLNASL